MYAVVFDTRSSSGQVESGKIGISGGKAVAIDGDCLCRRVVSTPLRRRGGDLTAAHGERFIAQLPSEYSGTRVRAEVFE